MDFPHSDDGSTLVSPETSSFLSPSLRGSSSESNLPSGEELIRSVPRSLRTEMSSVGDELIRSVPCSLRTEMSSVGDDVEVDDVLAVHDTIAAEPLSPSYIRDRDVALLKDTMTIDFASHAVVGDDDVVEVKGSMAVESGSPDVAPDDDFVVLVAAMEVEVASPVVVQDKDVVVAEEAMTFEGKLPAQGNDVVVVQDAMAVECASPGVVCTNKDVVAPQEQDSWHCARPRSGHSSPPVVGMGVEVASLIVDNNVFIKTRALPPLGVGVEVASPIVVDNNVFIQGLASPSSAGIKNVCSTPPILVDDPGAGQQKEGMEYLVNDGSSNVECPAPVLLPVVPEVPQVEEQVLNVTESASLASDETSTRENPSSSVGANLSSMKGSEGVSKFLAPEETDDVENEYSTTVLVDDSCARPRKEGLDCPVHDGSSIVGRAASVSLPVVFDISMAGGQTLNFAETSSKALEGASPCGSPGSSAGMKLSSMKGLAGALMFLTPGETDHTDDEYFSTPVVADKSGTGPHEEALECRVNDRSSMVERHASVSSPAISEIQESEEQVSNAAEISSKAFEEATPRESASSLADAKLSSMRGAEYASTLLVPEEVDHVDDEAVHEQQPAKRAKTNGTIYSGADAVTIVLGQTAEMVLVLAGMAQMRAGRIPTSYERELAATAYQNLGILVSQVAPNNLVGKESLERMLQYHTLKKVAQKKREDQAWFEALTEAEGIANVRAEALARAKAEAAARAQAELAARANAEAEEVERRQQVALKAAAVAAGNGLGKGDLCSVGSSPLSSGQSTYRLSEVAQYPTPPTAGVHPSSQAEMGSLVQLPPSKAGEVPLLVTQTEKIISVNGQPHTPASKPTLGRPPKVRNRVRKEAAGVTLFAPEFLNVVQSQVPDPQKAHVTHKELCLGVQQFIREHIPPISQNLQALPPTYISTPFPCQVCKLIAKDTGSVLVCDSCDEVSHLKCVQPPSRGASKGDWNCPKCLTASRGAKCPAKYGPIRHGSPNSVKLWPPHDLCQGVPEPTNSCINSSVRGGDELTAAGRQSGSGQLTAQGKASLEIDTRGHQSMDDQSTGNFGSSPHLIVHLVNEPSPRTNNPFNRSSDTFLQEGLQGPFPSGKSISAFVQETSSPMDLTKNVAIENQTQVQGKTGITIPGQSDGLITDTESQSFEEALQKSESQSAAGVLEDSVHEKDRRAAPAHIKKTETRTQATQHTKGNMESGMISPGKQAEVPLPIVMEWVGDNIRRAEGKVYYRACIVGGLAFSVSDCALFRPETPDVPPYIARLQVLWEDIATGHKWVRVSWCYYPTDIPLAMGRPGMTAPDEVYESNHCDNNLLGSIQGPCFVLPPLKFIEETERRRTLEKRGDAVEELPPIFLSRWMYDAPKGVFKPLQE